MGTIMQRIRDQIQTFIIFQRQPIENGNQDRISCQNNSAASDKNTTENSKTDGVRTRSSKQKLNVSDHSMIHTVKKDAGSHSDKSASDGNAEDSPSKSEESKEFEIYLSSLFTDLKCDNSIETRCSGALNLALYLAYDSPDVEFSDCLEALENLCDSHDFPHLAVCHALLLCAFTKMSMSIEDLIKLEENIIKLTDCLKKKNIMKLPEEYKVGVLVPEHKETTLKLCQEVFNEQYLDLQQVDISTICCCSLYNLSSLVQQFDSDLGTTYNFKDSTLKYILGMTGRSTQEIVSENLKSLNQKNYCPSMSLHRLKHCLHILEHALSINPDLTYRAALHRESSSLPHCLTRLLGWSVSFVFPEKAYEEIDSNYTTFHLSTLICVLKVLSILTFNPHQYDNFANVKGLMEKILICTLKAYFESEKSHFDIQILCLEMLINLYIKNQNTFVLLCLKRFRISDKEEMLAVEALLKMLSDNLEKIKEVKELYPQKDNKTESKEDSTKECEKDAKDEVPEEDARVMPDCESKTNENVENKDPAKKPRKETNPEVAGGITVKKSRKEINESNKSSQSLTNEHKENSENTSKDTLNEKPLKETSSETDAVLQAASRDMEHSTIVSFICVLIVFFMRTKQNFKEFILERLTPESLKEATIVSKKFLEFANLTGGMPVTGILILTETISKLQSFQSS